MVDNSKIVVLVEDDFFLEKDILAAIEKEGIKGKLVKPGSKLVSNLISIKPSIVILDIEKDEDEDDDFETILSIKEEKKLNDTEIFIYSEELQVKAEVILRKNKISSFYTKSGPVEHLITGIKNHFSRDKIYDDYDPWKEMETDDGINEEDDDEYANVVSVTEATKQQEADDFNKMLTDLHSELDQKIGATVDGAETYYNLGVSYYEMDMLEMAADQLTKSSLDSDWKFKSMNMLSAVYKKETSYEKAIEALKECYKIAPDDFAKLGCRYEIADTYVSMGRLQEAYKMFISVYRGDQKFKDIRQRLLDVKASIQENGKA